MGRLILNEDFPSEEVLSVDLFPKVDTFRGGRQVIIHGTPKLVDTSLDTSFFSQVLPASWVSSVTSGGVVKPSLQGVYLNTSLTVGSRATISTSAYASLEGNLSVQPLVPVGSNSNGVVDCCDFNFTIDSTNYCQIRIRRDPAVSPTNLVIDSIIGLPNSEVLTSGGVQVPNIFPGTTMIISIVRNANYVFLLLNGTTIASSNRFLSNGSGILSVYTTNNTVNTKVSTLVTGLTIRSHGIIGGRLIQDKTDFSTRRLTGNVPMASLAEVGNANIILFGPWGSLQTENPFQYQLPTGKAVGDRFVAYDDPSVKDN